MYIKEIKLKEDGTKKSLHINIGYRSGHFVGISGKSTVHDRLDRTWRHLIFGFDLIQFQETRSIQEEQKINQQMQRTVFLNWF